MISTDLIEYNIVGDMKTPLPRCFSLTSKLVFGENISTAKHTHNQTFGNLQFRPLVKKSFRSIHIDFRDTSGEKVSFASLGITRLVSMFTKKPPIFISNLNDVTRWLLQDKQRFYSTDVLVETVGKHSVHLHKFWKNCNSLLRKYFVPAAKRVGADLFDFAVPEIADVVSDRKDFETTAKSLRRQTLQKQMGSGSLKKVLPGSFQQNLQNKPVGLKETFLQTLLINHVEQFSVPNFCGRFWKACRERPGS